MHRLSGSYQAVHSFFPMNGHIQNVCHTSKNRWLTHIRSNNVCGDHLIGAKKLSKKIRFTALQAEAATKGVL